MRNDIRVYTDLPYHYKTKILERMAGGAGVWALIKLWIFAAGHCPEDGILRMTSMQIEAVCDWNTSGIQIVECFVECGFLEKTDDGYLIHDWVEMQPFVSGFAERSKVNTENIRKRWSKKHTNSKSNTNGIQSVYESDTKGNTPSYLPTILPTIPKEQRTYELQNSKANFAKWGSEDDILTLEELSGMSFDQWRPIIEQLVADKKCDLYQPFKNCGGIKWMLKENTTQTNIVDRDKMYWFDSVRLRYTK